MIELLAPAVTAVGFLIALFLAVVLISRLVAPGYRGPSWRHKNWLVGGGMLIATAIALAPFYL